MRKQETVLLHPRSGAFPIEKRHFSARKAPLPVEWGRAVSRKMIVLRSLIVLLLIAASTTQARAQLIIDGRATHYDARTNTLLASVPRQLFGTSPVLSVSTSDSLWASVSIASQPVQDSCYFRKIRAGVIYPVVMTDTLGQTVVRNLQFTFLPVVHLHGQIGYDYIDATIDFTDPDAPSTAQLATRVRWRGGTTNAPGKHKRNYKLKLAQDTTLLGMRHDDSWILDAGQADVFRLRNRIAMDLWNDMAPKPYWADREPEARSGVSGRVVEVFLDDDYRGFYNLSENMDRKQLKIRKVNPETGQIRGCLYKGINWDATQMFDSITAYDNTRGRLRGFEVKYPDLEDNDTTDWAPLVEAINIARTSTDEDFAQCVEDYYDLEPIFYYNIFASITNAYDNSGKNMYWAVYDKNIDRRLTPAPWDLDATFGQRWGAVLTGEEDPEVNPIVPESMNDVDVFIFYWLLKTNYKGYNDRLNSRYREMRQPGGLLHTDSLIQRFTDYYELITASGAAQREAGLWSGDSDVKGEAIDFDAEYAYICQWIERHMDEIDRHSFPLYFNDAFFGRDSEGIAAVPAETDGAGYVYDLQGRRVGDTSQFSTLSSQLRPGLYVDGRGRKVVVRRR